MKNQNNRYKISQKKVVRPIKKTQKKPKQKEIWVYISGACSESFTNCILDGI